MEKLIKEEDNSIVKKVDQSDSCLTLQKDLQKLNLDDKKDKREKKEKKEKKDKKDKKKDGDTSVDGKDPLLKDINPYAFRQRLVSNFYTFNFDQTQNIYLYSITTFHNTTENLSAHYGLIKKISKDRESKIFLRSYFPDIYITGNSLFAQDTKNINKLEFKVAYAKNKIHFIHSPEEESQMETGEIYTITITKKYKIADTSDKSQPISYNEKQHVNRFMNIILQNTLEKLNYIRSEPGSRAVYYKKGLTTQDTIQISDNVFFVYGFKVNTNIYQNKEILVKTIQKFRMIRSDTYLDYYLYVYQKMNNEENLIKYFDTFMKNRQGLARHTERRVKVTSVRYNVDISEFTFKMKIKGEEKMISMAQYYLDKYNYKIQHRVQPLAEQVEIKRGFMGKQIKQTTHFPLELLYIIGKIQEDKFDVAKSSIIPPHIKFQKTNDLMREFKQLFDEQVKLKDIASNTTGRRENKVIGNTNVNFSLKTLTSGVINPPVIEIGEKIEIVPRPDTGVFDLKNNKPYENKKLESWIVFSYDVPEYEVNNIGNLFNQAKIALGLDFNPPEMQTVDSRLYDKSVIEEYFHNYFVDLYSFCQKQGTKFPEICMLIIPSKKEYIYTNFKNALNALNLPVTIRSQVVKKEKIMKKGLTVAGNILLQMWAKRGLPLWRAKDIKKYGKGTLIAGYCVTTSSKVKDKSITALCATVSKDCVCFANYCMFHENTNKFSNVIGELLGNAVDHYLLINGSKPKRILLYREAVNDKQKDKVINLEYNLNIKVHPKLQGIKLTFIMVNKNCDLRFFKDNTQQENYDTSILKNINETNLETTTININSQNPDILMNAQPGSVIESGVTLDGLSEFYIVSSFSLKGTCNPTHYSIILDDEGINRHALYKLTYDLTYLYFNNQKCIRMPVVLHNANRMCSMAAKHLNHSYVGKPTYNFGY